MTLTREQKDRRNELRRKRWKEDPEFRARKLAEHKAWCAKNRTTLRAGINRWRQENPERVRAQRIYDRYRVSAAEYDKILAKPCSLCGEPSKHLDHCHETGRIRAGLCHRCNLALGWFQHDPARLRAAAEYIESWLAA